MKKILVLTAMGMALLLASCRHKDLCYNHPHTQSVEVIFDWLNAPDAVPASMGLYMFPTEEEGGLRFDFVDYRGGEIRLANGTYDAISMNSDTKNILYQNIDSQSTFEITTSSTSLVSGLTSLGVRPESAPRAESTEDERIAHQPEMLWNDHRENVLISSRDTVVTFYPEIAVCIYTVEIRNAENLKYVNGLSGSLTSMAGGLIAGRGELTDERVTIPFEVAISQDKTVVNGELLTFGHCPSNDNTHQLIIYAVLSDGSKWYYTYDVTEQIHTAPDPRHVHILLDGLPLPKPITNGGGFDPSVDEWESVDVNIDM